jgi:HTH-type transcriptional regulator/antitoxin MqsA
MKCPECGQAELIADMRDQPYTYKGKATIINHVRGEYCPACNEAVLRMDEARRVMQLQTLFNNEVNASSM